MRSFHYFKKKTVQHVNYNYCSIETIDTHKTIINSKLLTELFHTVTNLKKLPVKNYLTYHYLILSYVCLYDYLQLESEMSLALHILSL